MQKPFKKGDKVIFNRPFQVVKVRNQTVTITLDGSINLIVDKEYLCKYNGEVLTKTQ